VAVVSPSVVAAAEYLRIKTLPESVVLLDPTGEAGAEDSLIITGIAGRRVVLSGGHLVIYQAPAAEIEARKKRIRDFFMDPCGNAGVLAAYKTGYVWKRSRADAKDWGANLICGGTLLERIFEGLDVSLYRVGH